MPDALGNIHSVESFFWAEDYAFYHCTIIIVGIHPNSTTKQYKRLIFRRMTMYLNLRSWLHSIQESMTLIIQRLMEVIVHPQTGRFFCLCRNLI